MRRTRARAAVDICRIFFHVVDEFLRVVRRHRRMHRQHDRHLHRLGECGEILHRVIGQRLGGELHDAVSGAGTEHQRIAVCCGARHEIRTDHAAAAAVLHDDRLAHAFAHPLRKRAREKIGRSARRVRHHELDRFVRISLRQHRRAGPGRCAQNNGNDRPKCQLHYLAPSAPVPGTDFASIPRFRAHTT